MCVFYDGANRRPTEGGFMEKPGIEPATPGLKDIRNGGFTTGFTTVNKYRSSRAADVFYTCIKIDVW